MINGQTPACKTEFPSLKSSQKTLNQTLVEKAYQLAGIKGYVTNLDSPDEEVIFCYHQLFQMEAAFRMAKSDLKARPIFHWKRDSIEAHLTIALAALGMSRMIEFKTMLSIKHFIMVL